MCYMLYGAINREVSPLDYARLSAGSPYTIRPGTKQALARCIAREDGSFRVTTHPCDCDFPLGAANPDAEPLTQLAQLILALRGARNAKCVYLCKTWTGTENESEQTVHVDDIDLPSFLADAKTDCLYRIDLYKRHAP